ncbi:hypothetical protein SLE2022_053700 [Rubroshorea leprosula]
MATSMTLLVLLMTFLPSVILPSNLPPKNHGLLVAIEEMKKANYFTFVMLINMSPLDRRIFGNVTFLMPKDRALSDTLVSQNSVSDFLFRHSIPSPLLFEQFDHIPTGSIIPSSEPQYMLKVTNCGRRNFFLNNVKIISPNLCTSGNSIRCHGIDGVLFDDDSSLPRCPNNTISIPLGPLSAASPSPTPQVLATSPSTIVVPSDQSPVAVPKSAIRSPQKSESAKWVPYGKLTTFLLLLVIT